MIWSIACDISRSALPLKNLASYRPEKGWTCRSTELLRDTRARGSCRTHCIWKAIGGSSPVSERNPPKSLPDNPCSNRWLELQSLDRAVGLCRTRPEQRWLASSTEGIEIILCGLFDIDCLCSCRKWTSRINQILPIVWYVPPLPYSFMRKVPIIYIIRCKLQFHCASVFRCWCFVMRNFAMPSAFSTCWNILKNIAWAIWPYSTTQGTKYWSNFYISE